MRGVSGPTYVIFAGTREEFEHACHQRCLSTANTPWIQSVSDVERIQNKVNPIFMGTFFKNRAYIEIIKAMVKKGICDGGRPIGRAIESIDAETGRSETLKGVGDGFSSYADESDYESPLDHLPPNK